MALSVAALLSWQSTTDATSFTTASATPTANRLYLAWVETTHATAAPTPTASGWGLTWTQVATVHLADLGSGSARRITLFSSSGSGSSGTLVFSFGGVTATGCLGHVQEWTGAALPYIEQSITKSLTAGGYTSASTTLTFPVKTTATTTAVVGMVEKDAVLAFTVGTGFTSAYDNGYSTPATRALVEYDIGPTDGVLDCTWAATASGWTAIAVELGESKTLLGTLTDNFATIDTAKWNNWGGAQETIVSGELNLASTLAANYYGMFSQVDYDLTGSAASIKVTNQGNQAITSWEAYPLHLYRDNTNDVKWFIAGGTLQAVKTINSVATNQGAGLTFSLVTHKYLRIRESAGTVYWDYSADGVSWTNQTSIAVSSLFPVTAIAAEIIVGTWQAEASTTSMKVDDFNITVTTITGSATMSGTGALSSTGTLVKVGTATASGTGTLSATGTLIRIGVATASGTGALSSTAIVITFGATSMSGTGALSATGTIVKIGAATMAGTGALSASGVILIGGVVAMTGTGALSASGDVIVVGAVIMSAVGGMSVEAIRFSIFYPPVKAARRMTYPSDRVGLLLFTRSNKFVGVNVYILSNNVVTEIEPQDVTPPRPSISKIFYGGHDPYVVDDDEAALLVGAGYVLGGPQP